MSQSVPLIAVFRFPAPPLAAVRELRKLPVPREIVFKASELDKSNVQPADVPTDKLVCPKWEDAIKG